MCLRRTILRLAMKMAVRRPLPERIPLSDRARVAQRNYTAPFLVKNGNRRFLVEKVTKAGFDGIWFESDQGPGVRRSIENAEAISYDTHFEQYLAEMMITYRSPSEYLLYNIFGVPWLVVRRERFRQYLYNQKKPVKASRMRVLLHFLEKTQENHDYRAGVQKILDEIHGARWSRMEGNDSLYFNSERILDSLVEAGDLTYTGGRGYALTNHALITLENYEDDRARQREGSRLQKALIYVTIALAFVGIIQAYATLAAADRPLSALLRPFQAVSPTSPPTSDAPAGETPRGN